MTRRQLIRAMAGAAACSMSKGQVVNPSWVFLADQHLTHPTTWQPTAMQRFVQWVADNKTAYNIQAVLSSGDFEVPLSSAWGAGWSALDSAGIPWIAAPGNHDYDGGWNSEHITTRETTAWDADMGYSRLNGKAWYGGYWTDATYGSKANQYIVVGNYIIFSLEFFPRTAVITWVDGILAANPSKWAIITTHGYMVNDGSLIAQAATYGPGAYGLSADAVYDGAELGAWAATKSQIRAVQCGHWIPAGQAHRLDGSANGLYLNYQESQYAARFLVVQLDGNGATATVRIYDGGLYTGSPLTDVITPYSIPWQLGNTMISGAATISGRIQ